jgi:hypothetical protein
MLARLTSGGTETRHKTMARMIAIWVFALLASAIAYRRTARELQQRQFHAAAVQALSRSLRNGKNGFCRGRLCRFDYCTKLRGPLFAQ